MARTWTEALDNWLTTDTELGERVAGNQYAEDIIDIRHIVADRAQGNQYVIDVQVW
jgi:hypothetical protein